jgi:acetoin utilization deacetylase AcuC-like enzyme
MSKLLLIRDARFQTHLTPDSHPETPGRLAAIDLNISKWALASQVMELSPRLALETQLCYVHTDSYIELLNDKAEKAKEEDGLAQLDADTYMSGASYEIARLAAGAGFVALDEVSRPGKISEPGQGRNAFVAVRPPGHHALADAPMGFCLFNNIALAARYAQKEKGYKKIFIIDWDVHHGNGTQWAFYDDPSVFFCSFHQYPFWPYDSGWYLEDGSREGRGYNLNIPLPRGTGDRGYLKAFDTLVEPIILAYQPDLILVSAGYDAHRQDPLGDQQISTAGYAMLTQRVRDLSLKVAGAAASPIPVVVFLEGGYNVKTLAESTIATMRVLNAQDEAELGAVHASYLEAGFTDEKAQITGDAHANLVDERVAEVAKHFKRYWKVLGT